MSEEKPVIVVGIGELGGVFARGLLRSGRAVFPVTRQKPLAEHASLDPELVLLTVGETELDLLLGEIPERWKSRVGLVQNELLPYVWQAQAVSEPTLCIVWFEKKPGRDVHVVQPSVVFGPGADLLSRALRAIGVPCRSAVGTDELLFELVSKNLYILTTNLAGLETGGSVRELWTNHARLAREVAAEVLDLQEHLAGARLPRSRLLERLEAAIAADPEHLCTGRSAPARLERVLRRAERAKLSLPRLSAIAAARNIAP